MVLYVCENGIQRFRAKMIVKVHLYRHHQERGKSVRKIPCAEFKGARKSSKVLQSERRMRLGKEVGYARVSSREQNLDRQIIALRKYVPEDMIVTDKASGKDFNRPGYQSLKFGIGKLVKGDTLYIKSLDRFSRNKEEAKKELQYFSDLGVRVKILDLPSTMTDISEGQEWILEMINNILIEVLTSISENERMTIRSRQAEGLAAMPIDENSGKKVSKKTGRCIGRPPVGFPAEFGRYYGIWKKREITAVAAMKALNLKPSSFYKLVHQYETENTIAAL